MMPPCPASGKMIVSLGRFTRRACGAGWLGTGRGRAHCQYRRIVASLAQELASQPLIAVEIPKMADGRACYSQARVLRERYAYRGEIRAQGDVLHDQLFHMSRCGINAFELRADQDAQDCLRAFGDYDLAYQRGADGIETVWQKTATVCSPR